MESYHWGIWEQNIALEMVKEDWSILSFSAKWLNSKEVIYFDTGGRGVRAVRNDMGLLERLWALLDEADIVVTQNGKSFDIRRINARLIQSGFEPYSPIRVIDTMLVAKRHFDFSSNKLAFLTKKLTKTIKRSHKKFPGFALWAECLKDNPKAWKEMRLYNATDVRSTEELYLVLRPWIDGHPNVAVYGPEMDKPSCPKCGHRKLENRGRIYTQSGSYTRYRCYKCKGLSKGRKRLEKRGTLVTN